MGKLSLALAIGTALIDGVANALGERSQQWQRELHDGESEADRQREEAVVSAARTAARQIVEHVCRQNNEAAPVREDAAVLREAAAAKLREEAALAEAEKAKMEAAAKLREEAAVAETEKAKMKAAAKLREGIVLPKVERARMEVAAKLREEATLAKVEKAKEALQQGFGFVVMPTPEQISAAKERIQYNPKKVHFAVCGVSGSGKSTLINAFRGLKTNSDGAAHVGAHECAPKITRYPDPRNQTPYSRFVWYDIPGAGTTAVSDSQYFNDQGLFVFDVIILMYDLCFTPIDVGVVRNCLRFNIPVFIVRSKAKKHIYNMWNVSEYETDYGKLFSDKTKKYIEATRSDFNKHMQIMAEEPECNARDRQMLLGQRVYIVEPTMLRSLSETITGARIWIDKSNIIDEISLLNDGMKAAIRFLCDKD